MTIKTHLQSIAAFLVLSLTAIRGRLTSYVLRSESVESSAPTATESTQSNSKAITPAKPLKKRFVISAPSMDSNPEARIDAIINGRVGLDFVTMAEWVQLSIIRMANGKTAHMNVNISYGGGVYLMHHCVEQANPPGDTGQIMEQEQ